MSRRVLMRASLASLLGVWSRNPMASCTIDVMAALFCSKGGGGRVEHQHHASSPATPDVGRPGQISSPLARPGSGLG
jgi:hypothetical protein